MDLHQKKESIVNLLSMQNRMFNPDECPDKDVDVQYFFHEEEGVFNFYLSIKNKESRVVEGSSDNPTSEIITDLHTLIGMKDGIIDPKMAMEKNLFAVKGDFMFFMNDFRKIFNGKYTWKMPDHLYTGTYEIEKIKKVLVLNCAPRCEKGATAVVTERFVAGMKKAGAEVEVLFPARMKINPCIGCFQCWVNNTTRCIYHDRDDMKIILEKYWTYDLVVWATPIYHYHGTTLMKTVMDRLFINADAHFIEIDGEYRHPRKVEHLPYYAVLAVGGFPAMNIFDPLQSNFKTLSAHTGIKLVGEIYRHTCIPFIFDECKLDKKDEVLAAIEKAGTELIESQKISDDTKQKAEQDILDVEMLPLIVNQNMDQMLQNKEGFLLRKRQITDI